MNCIAVTLYDIFLSYVQCENKINLIRLLAASQKNYPQCADSKVASYDTQLHARLRTSQNI